jgi:hypothetical protein
MITRNPMTHKGGFPYREHRCEYCQRLAVTYPHGHALCAEHAADPNSETYIVKLEQIKTKYLDLYSVNQWDAFCLRTFESNGKNYEDFTWKEIAEAAGNELEHPTECHCVLPEQSCHVCRATARLIYNKDYKEA